jgi:integrase
MSKITESTAKRLQNNPPASGQTIEWDSDLKGFGVRVTANGVVAFILSYRFEGEKKRYTIGRYGEDQWSAAAARKKAGELKIGIDAGIDPLAERKKKKVPPSAEGTEPTFADLAKKYLVEHAGQHKRASSIRNDKSKLDGVLARWNDLSIAAISQDDVEKLKRDLQATPIQANRTLALLSKMFNLASLKWHYRPDNPVKGVQRFKEVPREVHLENEQVAALKQALDNYRDQNASDAIRLLLLTGARESEALKSDWTEFDLKRGIWHKPRRHMKADEPHHVPLSEDAVALLRKMKPQKSGPLFPGANGGYRVTIRKPWIQICRAAGLATAVEKMGKRRRITRYKPNFHIHDLRHTYASWLVSNGVELYDVSKLLGHSRIATTERYAHHADESLRKATNVFGGLFRNAEATQ